MADLELIDFNEVRKRLGTGRAHLLLGNGFSIACHPVFSYGSLFDSAVAAGLSDRAQSVFQRLGTNNFEGVIRLLADARWIAVQYGLSGDGIDELADDIEVVKKTLLSAVAKSHLPHSGSVSDEKKAAALKFLKPFFNIFTSNYDLLLYWVVMSKAPEWGDGFRSELDDPEAPSVVFAKRLGNAPGMFFLHGALHLYVEHGVLRKRCWSRTQVPLIEAVKDGLDHERYPLFVAEGAPDRKLEQIQRSFYLGYSLDKLKSIQGPLVVFGHSLGASDGHIVAAIAENFEMTSLYVGLHGDPGSAPNLAIRSAVASMQERRKQLAGAHHKKSVLEATFYRSESAHPWGD